MPQQYCIHVCLQQTLWLMKIIHCMLMLAYCWLSTRCGLCMYNIFHNEHVYNGDIFYMLLITRQKSTGAG